MAKFSVVLTIFNKENVLDTCINSLINQTYKEDEIEIVLIDDGSSDNSPMICDYYEKRYSNIVAIHQINQGVAEARNAGLKAAKGEYITFIDADDYLDLTIFENLYKFINNQKVIDMISWGCMEENQRGDILARIPMENIVFSNKKEAYLYINSKILGYVWLWAFRREMLIKNEITFDKYLEPIDDYCFVLQAFEAAEKVATVADSFYHYVRSDSLESLSKRIPKHVFQQHKKISTFKYQLLQNLDMEDKYIEREMKLAAYAAFKNGVKQLFRANEDEKVKKICLLMADPIMEKWFFNSDISIQIKESEVERYEATVKKDYEKVYVLFKRYEEEKVRRSENL